MLRSQTTFIVFDSIKHSVTVAEQEFGALSPSLPRAGRFGLPLLGRLAQVLPSWSVQVRQPK